MRQRARKVEDKQERQQAILDAAWQMFQELPYAAITMAEIATKLGLAKGTVYLYFKTKEALFLAVHQQQLEAWFEAIDRQLSARTLWTSDEIAALFVESVQERPAMTRLHALLPSVLEHNIDFDTALFFKRWLLAHVERTGALLEKAWPFLAPGTGGQLILRIHALVIGFQQMSDPVPVVRQVLQEPDLRVMDIDFINEFSATLRLLLYGLEWRKKHD